MRLSFEAADRDKVTLAEVIGEGARGALLSLASWSSRQGCAV